MAVDMFLKLEYGGADGALGESQDRQHRGEIDVLAWAWGISNHGTAAAGGKSRGVVQDMSITKYVDSASNDLLKLAHTGQLAESATLVVRKPGARPFEYVIIKMTNVLVTSVSTGGSAGDDRLTENVTLNFAEFAYTYVLQSDDGKAGTAQKFSFDVGP